MLKSNFWLLIFGCPPDNQIIILGCPTHVLVVSGERTTTISNAAYTLAHTAIASCCYWKVQALRSTLLTWCVPILMQVSNIGLLQTLAQAIHNLQRSFGTWCTTTGPGVPRICEIDPHLSQCRRHRTYGLIFGNLGGRYADAGRKSPNSTHIAILSHIKRNGR